ncbi:MAG TPA: FlgD immunoglobulin-like domain containing protein [Candidatus Krumholzibacteria bacterium]|nr:FlgD immunoglobulin-like domain containing protein [Candidatus Krumholzibacteria bacterium]
MTISSRSPYALASLVLLVAEACLAFLLAEPAAGQTPIGIYGDVQGNTCSLADPSPGFINAYIVVHPGLTGVSGVQFAAPKPACFSATYLGDATVAGTLVSGSSQTGVSVALTQCSTSPVHILTIQYYGFGTTAACCAYPVTGPVEVLDCSYAPTPAVGVVSTINPDASCACSGNSPPWPPDSPQPVDGEPAAAVTPALAWSATDFDGNISQFDLYLGSTPSPPLLVAGLTQPEYTAGPLLPFTQHFWRVVARDTHGLESSSPVWTFTTRAVNTPPAVPGWPAPADGSVDQPVGDLVVWRCSDIDGDTLRYDVYFGTSSPPPLVVDNDPTEGYFPGTLAFSTTYYWRVVARDTHGAEVSGPEWSFVTRPANFPPTVPAGASPWNGATNQPRVITLKWSSADADGHAITYDVYFGDSAPPPQVAADWPTRGYPVDTLQFDEQYYWKVVARDELGAETPGPEWTFTVKANSPPQTPATPTPANNSSNRPINQQLAWLCSDEDGHAIVYDIYFGAVSPPPLVAPDVAARAWLPGTLEHLTAYYWKVVARDELGAESEGPVWRFTTAPVSQPPGAPSLPNPANNSTGRPLVQLLGWQCVDPDGDPVKYDVYFGAASPPALLATNVATKSLLPDTLLYATKYYWRILARDVWGVEQTGPEWNFTTRPENYPPTTPSQPYPSNGAVDVSVLAGLSWHSSDGDGDALSYDVFFGDVQPPPQAAAGRTIDWYQPDTLQTGTRYYWRILARDSKGAETSGPEWNFTTRPNQPPTTPAAPFPHDGALAPLSPTLAWVSSDPEGKPVSFDVYFGAEFPLPLAASGLTAPVYLPGALDATTVYRWFVLAHDGETFAVGPIWSFTASLSGDANQDGVVSLADAACALRAFVQQDCAPVGMGFTDVDCSGETTPGDALCIHRNVEDGSCSFCAVTSSPARREGAAPVVATAGVWQVEDTLTISLKFDGIPQLHACGFSVAFSAGARLLDVVAGSGAPGYTDFASSGFSSFGLAGGYSLDGISAGSELARMHFLLAPGTQVIYVDGFADDLSGAARLTIVWEGLPSRVPDVPGELALGQNHPNPFNPATTIPYRLPGGSARVRLIIFDLAGKVVRTLVDATQAGGPHEAVWDGSDGRGEPVSSGIYFCVLDADGQRSTRKMVLLK